MTCPKCSATIEPDSRFCRQCGAALATGGGSAAAPSATAHTAGDPHRDPAHEQEVWAGRPCWRASLGWWLLWAAGSMAAVYFAHKHSAAGSELRTAAWVLIGGLGAALFVREALLVLGTRYRLTTQRLFVQRGILSRLTDQIELVRVDDVRLRQGIIDRLAGTGDIEILGSDKTDETLRIDGVAAPSEVVERLRGIVRSSRGKGTLFVENV